MPPGTGGRGSYGHRHPGQEEIYFVLVGTATFKVGDEVFEAAPKTAVRMTGEEFYSVHNDTDEEIELVLMSTRLAEPPTERQEDFWPE
jgi:mannose-6-phosphate isomerase-like protein (cupin superfamily)